MGYESGFRKCEFLFNKLWLGTPLGQTIEADAQAQKSEKKDQIIVKGAKNDEEQEHFANKGGQQEGIELAQRRLAKPGMPIQKLGAGNEQPAEPNRSQNAKGNNDR